MLVSQLSSPAAVKVALAPCDASSAAQHWALSSAGWGANNTIQNLAVKAPSILCDGHPGEPCCLDVFKYQVQYVGATIDAHSCCEKGSSSCGHPEQNYNQQWNFEATDPAHNVGHVRVMSAEREPALCLEADGVAAGALLTLNQCGAAGRDAQQTWSLSADGSAPLLRLHADVSLCVASGASGPSPPPPPPSTGRGCTLANVTHLPFCDTKLSSTARAKDLVGRMRLDEKLTQLICGIGGGVTPATPRLGVPAYQYHSEGLHGLRTTCKLESKPLYSTLFPQVTGMAATGNLSAVRAMAAHMADEARAVNNRMGLRNAPKGGGLNYWGPTMNIGRDPRCLQRDSNSQYPEPSPAC
jgi:hypothetical protein